MKVKDLIKQLKEHDGNLEILVSSDPEGNNIQKIPKNCLSGESVYEGEDGDISVYDLDWSAEDAGMDEDDWEEAKKDLPKCIILYP